MSGHSKWATIKHKKAANDSKKGKVWSKVAKEITIAVREGGNTDPAMNSKLRVVIMKAKAANMPNDNIDRAIKKGSGEGAEAIEEIIYEGYGPGGVAMIVETTTDNRNRTTAEIRALFSKHGGNMGENGCVSWQFKKKSMVVIPAEGITEDELMELILDADPDEIENEDEMFTITAPMESFATIIDALKTKNIEPVSAEIVRIADNNMTVAKEEAKRVLKLIGLFEDHDDVGAVATNLELTDEIMAEA